MTSIDPREIARFALLAGEWWNPDGGFAALHRLNPVRLRYIRDIAAQHLARDPGARAPFGQISLLDVGCGGGLLAEPLARQGFDVLGIDAAPDGIAAAQAHADGMPGAPRYRCATAEALASEGVAFDVVVAMEVIEHVADRAEFLHSCAALVRPGGLMFAATINRTLKALALAKIAAEYILGWTPRGTHDWAKFVSPHVLSDEMQDLGFAVLSVQGVSFDPLAWNWRSSADTDVNYMLAATKQGRLA